MLRIQPPMQVFSVPTGPTATGLTYAEAWIAYTPTVTNGGTLGTVVGRYLRDPWKMTVQVTIPVTTAGAGAFTVSLPVSSSAASYTAIGVGWDNNNATQLTATIQANTSIMTVYKTSTGAYPAVNGSLLSVEISYETT